MINILENSIEIIFFYKFYISNILFNILMNNISKYLTSFGKHFLIGGFAVAILSLIIEIFQNGIVYSSYLYAALPTVYFYLAWVAYKKEGKNGIQSLNVHIILGTFIFMVYVACVIGLHHFGLKFWLSMLISLIFFIILSYFYYKGFLKKKFLKT